MCSTFDDEDIDALPNPAKEYQITTWRTASKITLLMKWIILYKEHNVLITKIKELIKTTDTINKQCSNGFTALIMASELNRKEIVRLLLGHPTIDVNLQNNDGYTALIWASYNGYEGIVRLLLGHPTIDVNLQNNYGYTALIRASEDGYEKIVRLLLGQLTIDVNLQTNDGSTALILAS